MERDLFRDAQVFCIVFGLADASSRERLARHVDALTMAPSPVGTTIPNEPHRVRFYPYPPRWGSDGGVWAAIDAFLAWGLADVDRLRCRIRYRLGPWRRMPAPILTSGTASGAGRILTTIPRHGGQEKRPACPPLPCPSFLS